MQSANATAEATTATPAFSNPVLTPKAERLVAESVKRASAPKSTKVGNDKRSAKASDKGVRFSPGAGIINPVQARENGKHKGRKSPKSTIPKIVLETVSSSQPLDVDALVAVTAQRKADIGETFTGIKGKQPLFAAVCAAYKNRSGMTPMDRLNAKAEDTVRTAIDAFWRKQADRIMTYGEVVSASFDKPKGIFTDTGEMTATKCTAAIRAQRDPSDKSEDGRNTNHLLAKATARLAYMLENPAKYDRIDVTAARNRIASIERRQAVLIGKAKANGKHK